MENKKIKVLCYMDSPSCATGFGCVSRNILVPMYNTGRFEIVVLGINYFGNPHGFPFDIWPVLLNQQHDPYGREKVQQQIPSMDFDILFTLQDSFILEFVKDFIPNLRMSGKKFRHVQYYPIDGVPKPSWIEAMAVADVPITYTEFGRKESIKAFPEIGGKLRVISHGVNTQDFRPLDYREVVDFRAAYFGPFFEKFIITNVNRNQQRKDIPRMMLAFREFQKIHPDSVLYCHCAIRDQGWDLEEVSKSLGLKIGKDIAFPTNFSPNQGYPLHILNLIYNASDAVVSSSLGEGFGLAQVEAMATRTPVISPANTACPEIVGEDRGLLVKSGHTIDHHTVLPHDNEVLRPLISIPDMVEKMCVLYENEYLRHKLAENGYNWVVNNLDWEKHIAPQWIDLMFEVYDDLVSAPAASGPVSAMEI